MLNQVNCRLVRSVYANTSADTIGPINQVYKHQENFRF